MDALARNNVTVVGLGDGPPLLLAHGFGCDQKMWRRVVDRLAGTSRIVLIDHVGSGAADPRSWDERKYSTLQGYADDLMIGALAVIANPQPFAKLVMVTPSPRYLDDVDYRGGFSAADIDELLESLEANYLGWSHAMAPVIMGNPDRPELGDELDASFCRTDPACARVFARTTFLSDNRDDLASIPVPTLVIECTHDAIAPREAGAYVHSRVRDSTLITLEATGHCPHVSDPDATAQAIAAFAATP